MNRLAALEAELREEIAGSLGRVAEKLEADIRTIRRLASEHASAPADLRPALARDHAAARAHAKLFLWYLQVQREAIGLYDHRRLLETYVIPPALAEPPRR